MVLDLASASLFTLRKGSCCHLYLPRKGEEDATASEREHGFLGDGGAQIPPASMTKAQHSLLTLVKQGHLLGFYLTMLQGLTASCSFAG